MEVYPCLDQQNRPWPETLLKHYMLNVRTIEEKINSTLIKKYLIDKKYT